MTVKELIDLLERQDSDRIVIMARDAEGNSYSPLSDAWIGAYRADNTWSGEVGLEKLTKQLKKDGYTEEDVLEGEPALILCPVN